MVKLPQAGRVKTRLARGTSTVRALQFYRTTSAAVLGRVGRDPRWETILAVSPDTAGPHPAWPSHLARMGQGRGDLGQRLDRIMTDVGPGPVVIVGTDIPEIQPGPIAAAFRALGSADAVFGPATDGGYWLVGLKRRPKVRRIFDRVRWSTEYALADTRANIADRAVAFVGRLNDVDEAIDLDAVRPWLGRRICPARPGTRVGV